MKSTRIGKLIHKFEGKHLNLPQTFERKAAATAAKMVMLQQ